jgi:hypothetical protein
MPEEEQGTLNTGRSRQPLFDPLSFAFCIPTKPGALWQAIGDKEARMADTVGASGEYPGWATGMVSPIRSRSRHRQAGPLAKRVSPEGEQQRLFPKLLPGAPLP